MKGSPRVAPRFSLRDEDRIGAFVNFGVLVVCIAAAGLLSIARGQDANWDLQNYHFYIPWAYLQGRLYTWDIAAAQLQTYHNPLPDIPFYLMVQAGWRPRTIAFVLAIPTGVAAFFLLKLLPLLFRELPLRERRAACIASAGVGLTSAMAIGVLGTTMNEWPGTALTIAALWLIVRGVVHGGTAPLSAKVLLAAGLLCGLATGAKLTFGIFALGLCAGILLRGSWTRITRSIPEAFVFGVAVLAGTAITAGPWMWALWSHFGNPVFPYANVWIRSPWWGNYPVLERDYGPHTFLQWLGFPFRIAAPPEFFVAEVKYTDARLAALYVAALIAGLMWLVRRFARVADGTPAKFAVISGSDATWRLVGVFWLFSFAVWTAQFSIYRYIVPLELLSGALLVALLLRLFRPVAAWPAVLVISVVLIAYTQPADWWHTKFRRQWFDVDMPVVEPNALVLLATDEPMAYVLPFFPVDARFLGVKNNINDPGRDTLIEKEIERAIRAHRGPLYSLAYPAGKGAAVLAAHGLMPLAGACGEVRTNMRVSPIELCRLGPLADHAETAADPGMAGKQAVPASR